MSKGELKWREEVKTRLQTCIFDKSYCCDVEYLEGLRIKIRLEEL